MAQTLGEGTSRQLGLLDLPSGSVEVIACLSPPVNPGSPVWWLGRLGGWLCMPEPVLVTPAFLWRPWVTLLGEVVEIRAFDSVLLTRYTPALEVRGQPLWRGLEVERSHVGSGFLGEARALGFVLTL